MKFKMNEPQWCYGCQEETGSKEWDCVKCGFSKGHPNSYEDNRAAQGDV